MASWDDIVHPSTWGSDIKEGYDATVGRVLGSGTPTKPDLSASTTAGASSVALANSLAAQRQNLQPTSAPQIQASGQVGAAPTGGMAGQTGGNGIGAHGPTTSIAPMTPAQKLGIGAPGSPPAGGAGGSAPSNGAIQQNALGMLQAQAAGTAPSAAQIQTSQNLGTQMANQYALASALQGRHPGAAYNAAAQGTATAQGTAAGQGALLRAQEQAQAQNTLATAAGGARGQDIQTQTANLNAQLTSMGYDEQTKNALLAAQLQAQGYDVSTANAIIGAQTQAAASANAFKGGLITTAGQIATS